MPGDVVRLQPGAVFQGTYTLPVKSNPTGLFITVRSAANDALLPPAGTRITPSHAPYLPTIQSSDTLPALVVPPGASYWRLQLLEFAANVNGSSDIIRVGTHLETVPTNQPRHIVFDRVYVHGDPTIGQKNGLVVHAAEFVLRDSHVSDIKLVGTETHAFLAYNGPGPYLLENNYLEAAGINVLFGGADPANAAMIPSNVTVRRNLVAKNPAWMTPRGDGKYWTVKNLFELKSGRQVKIEGNVFEYNWSGAGDQPGHAVLLRTENQSGSCDWCETGPVTFQNNIVRHSTGALSLIGLDYPSGGAARGVRMHDVVIRNNLFADITNTVWRVGSSSGTSKFALVNGVDRLTIDHNTIIMGPMATLIHFSGEYASPEFTYANNMSEHKTYGMKGDGTGVGYATLAAYTLNYVVTANVLAGGKASSYPLGNQLPTVADWQAQFGNFSGGDYRLRPDSIYRNAGSDGKDLGAAIDEIDAAIAAPPPPVGNRPPSATNKAVSTPEDTAAPILLAATDADGDALVFSIKTSPSHGALSGTAPSITYVPAANFSGSDSFTFAVDDGKGGTASGVVTITVTPVNDAPVANSQNVSTTAGTPVAIVLAGSDVDGDALAWWTATPQNGTLSGVPPEVTYTPRSGFTGTDSFAYSVSDGQLASNATVTISVSGSGGVHVADLDGSTLSLAKARWQGVVRIQLHDDSHAPVAGATVTGTWSGGFSGTRSCVTDITGSCSVSTANIKSSSSTATLTITDVTQSPPYRPTYNHDPESDSNGSRITVSKP